MNLDWWGDLSVVGLKRILVVRWDVKRQEREIPSVVQNYGHCGDWSIQVYGKSSSSGCGRRKGKRLWQRGRRTMRKADHKHRLRSALRRVRSQFEIQIRILTHSMLDDHFDRPEWHIPTGYFIRRPSSPIIWWNGL